MTQQTISRPTGPQRVMLVGVVLALIGPFLPWYVIGAGAFRHTQSGMTISDGTWVLITVGFAGVLALASMNRPVTRGVRVTMILLGSWTLLIALYDLGHLAAKPGEFLTALGAALILGGAVRQTQP